MNDLIYTAVNRGLVSEEDSRKLNTLQMEAIRMIVEMMDDESIKEFPSDPDELDEFSREIAELNDIMDLEDCDRVEPNKSFGDEEEIELNFPIYLIPFMMRSVFPEIRKKLLEDS